MGDQDIMHVTLFYTSHPDDLAPRKAQDERKSERLSREISLRRELATQFEPVRMIPVKVVLAASGAVLLLLQCVEGDGDSTSGVKQGEECATGGRKPLNAGRRAEFSVDLLRQAARDKLPFVSEKSPRAIIHSTLARVLSPDAFNETALTRVREVCHRISQRLRSAEPNDVDAFVVSKLWYVDEAHFIRPTGTPPRSRWGRQRQLNLHTSINDNEAKSRLPSATSVSHPNLHLLHHYHTSVFTPSSK